MSKTCLSEFSQSPAEGSCSKASPYPGFERAYFKRVYGSDHYRQLHDKHQKEAILRFVRSTKRSEVKKVLNQLAQLPCVNDPAMTAPGRSAYSLAQLSQNLDEYCLPKARSLRWNEHYQEALAITRDDILRLLKRGSLKPMDIDDVAASAPIQQNLEKNAGYMAFLTGKRSKGENLEEAVEWYRANKDLILKRGEYGIPLVISHRSSNSKPSGKGWKWKCRVILMQDIRALLADGRFAVPFTDLFKSISWGEGSMTHEEVDTWIRTQRLHYDSFYSSDYSKYDINQPAWLLEDVFNGVIKPCFRLSDQENQLFDIMVSSYINKEIHSFDGVRFVTGAQLSGSLFTYAINTIVNEVIDRTVLLMQGCDISGFKSLKCGDDNLTFFNKKGNPWSKEKHCELIKKYFGITTTMADTDYGSTVIDPPFLSRVWTWGGATRDIREVLWNLVYPERYRDYDPEKTHVSVERAEALVLYSSCLEQEKTMREYFDVRMIRQVAQISPKVQSTETYVALAKMGSGFRTPWINFRFGTLKQNVAVRRHVA